MSSNVREDRVRVFQLGPDLIVAEILTQNDKRAVIRFPLIILRGKGGGTRLLTPQWYEVSESETFIINHWSLRHVVQTKPNESLLKAYIKVASDRPPKKSVEEVPPPKGDKPTLKLLKFNPKNNSDSEEKELD